MQILELLKNGQVDGYNNDVYSQSKAHWDNIIKPLNSMGRFEEIISRIAAIKNQMYPDLSKNLILVFASDNGIVEEGISQSGHDVTAICSKGIAQYRHSVSVMARSASIDVLVVDVGVIDPIGTDLVIDKKIRKGTRNFAKEEAMTIEETLAAMQTGLELAKKCSEENYGMVGVGEMGIGNTTTSTAVACALLNLNPAEVTGRGAGLDSKGLQRKIDVITDAIIRYELDGADPLRILSAVGGYDIAAMTGLYIGGAVYQIPIVMDGVISSVAALLAEKLMPGVVDYIIPSHISREPVMAKITEKLGLDPVIDASMALGEGSGAVLMMNMIKMAYEVYQKAAIFEDTAIEQYEHLN